MYLYFHTNTEMALHYIKDLLRDDAEHPVSEIYDYVMENCGRPLSEQSIGIGYSSDIRPAQRFIALLQGKVKPKRIDIADIGCVVGTHIGPGAFGIFWEDVR